MTKKVAINDQHGGFGLSLKALDLVAELKGHGRLHHYAMMSYEDRIYHKITTEKGDEEFHLNRFTFIENVGESFPEDDLVGHYERFDYNLECERHDKDLIKVIETLGSEANGRYARLKIIEIPKEVDYQIEDFDGREWVAEEHRTWS